MSHDDGAVHELGSIPELAPEDPRRYHMDMDWVWSRKYNRELQKTATVRATVRAEDSLELMQRFDDWSANLHGPDTDNVFVHGGWFCQREHADSGTLVLLFGSGGQDVAESLDYGIQWFSGAVLKSVHTSTVTWEELPLN